MRYLHRTTTLRTLILLGLCLAVLAACKKEGAVPAYLELDQPVVVAANGQPVSSKITDAWVYVNDQPVGVWEPGKQIPVIAKGASRVKVIAGVRKNGITDSRIQYPFYETWQQQVDLVQGQTTVVHPQVRYYDNLTYWLADFDTGVRFDTLECTATMAIVPSDSTLTGQGHGNGHISLDIDHPMYYGVSSGDPFTNTGSTAFLELDYRSNTRLLVGVRYSLAWAQQKEDIVYALPTDQGDGSMRWNKLYVDLAGPWNVPGAMNKRFFIKAELENGALTGSVDVDNIKLVRP